MGHAAPQVPLGTPLQFKSIVLQSGLSFFRSDLRFLAVHQILQPVSSAKTS